MQSCKEAKKAKQVAHGEQASISASYRVEKGVYQAHPHHGGVSHKWYLSTTGTNATTRVSGLKDRQTQSHGGHKAWQSLDLDRKTWI